MRKARERYVVWLWVAPFVKQYLLTNFAVEDVNWTDLVNISSDRYLDVLFRSRLMKPSNRYDKRIEASGSYKFRNVKVALEITKSDFLEHGWSLTPTDASALSKALEIRCRTILLTYLSAAYMITPNLSACIQKFYESYHFDEETWPSDSIRRIWNRDKTIDKTTLKTDIDEKINKIILVQLFRNGTISQQGLKTYEDNSIRL